MSASNYNDLKSHVGHDIECVSYGDNDNIAVECTTCNMVLMDFNKEDDS